LFKAVEFRGASRPGYEIGSRGIELRIKKVFGDGIQMTEKRWQEKN
jgi:hypothetical protein